MDVPFLPVVLYKSQINLNNTCLLKDSVLRWLHDLLTFMSLKKFRTRIYQEHNTSYITNRCYCLLFVFSHGSYIRLYSPIYSSKTPVSTYLIGFPFNEMQEIIGCYQKPWLSTKQLESNNISILLAPMEQLSEKERKTCWCVCTYSFSSMH